MRSLGPFKRLHWRHWSKPLPPSIISSIFILFKAYTEFRINRAARIDRTREQVIADHAKSPTLHKKLGESKRLFQGLPILCNKGVHIFKLWKASFQCFVVPVPPAGRLQALDDFL